MLLVDMPGVRAEGAELTLEKNVLTIRGRTDEVPPGGFALIYREHEPGDYERIFRLSDDVHAKGIEEAQARDGVFKMFLPKAGPAQTKRIQVKAS